jgi:hypothetical protein
LDKTASEQTSDTDQEFCRYRGIEAHYRDVEIPCYKGNPLIEALPPIYSEAEVASLLAYDPGYDEQHRQWSSELRLQLILNATRFIQPLSHHIGLEQLLSGLIRSGYSGRNPFATKAFHFKNQQRLQHLRDGLWVPSPPQATARGGAVVGLSGVGKSTAMNSILGLYDQIINHSRYQGQFLTLRQLVWMKLECPQDGLLSGLCKNFFKEVDRLLETNTYKLYVRSGRRGIDEMLIDMAAVAARHCLGILVIDEIQNLREAKGDGAAHLLNFLVQLDNQLGIPVVVVGTPKALPILSGEFRRARRASGQGGFPWDRMQEDEEWTIFTDTLWKYQYVRNPTLLNDELRHALYYESQGITDLAVKVSMLAQIEAITSEQEIVTKELFEIVAQQRLRFVQPFLHALRAGVKKPEELKKYEDIAPIDLEWSIRDAVSVVRNKQTSGSTQVLPHGTPPQEAITPDSATKNPDRQQVEQRKRPSKKKGDGTSSKLTLVQAVAKGQIENRAAYESLQQAGFIFPIKEYLREDTSPSLSSNSMPN